MIGKQCNNSIICSMHTDICIYLFYVSCLFVCMYVSIYPSGKSRRREGKRETSLANYFSVFLFGSLLLSNLLMKDMKVSRLIHWSFSLPWQVILFVTDFILLQHLPAQVVFPILLPFSWTHLLHS